MATVTACHYEFGAGQALAFGIPKSKHFQISFNYWAGGELHTGEFASAKAVPQGTLFPIRYDPEAPHDHRHDRSGSSGPRSLFVLLSMLLVALVAVGLVHGCDTFVR